MYTSLDKASNQLKKQGPTVKRAIYRLIGEGAPAYRRGVDFPHQIQIDGEGSGYKIIILCTITTSCCHPHSRTQTVENQGMKILLPILDIMK